MATAAMAPIAMPALTPFEAVEMETEGWEFVLGFGLGVVEVEEEEEVVDEVDGGRVLAGKSRPLRGVEVVDEEVEEDCRLEEVVDVVLAVVGDETAEEVEPGAGGAITPRELVAPHAAREEPLGQQPWFVQ